MKIDKKRGRELLKQMERISEQQKDIKWDFLGLRFMKLQNKWNKIESELHKICFGH